MTILHIANGKVQIEIMWYLRRLPGKRSNRKKLRSSGLKKKKILNKLADISNNKQTPKYVTGFRADCIVLEYMAIIRKISQVQFKQKTHTFLLNWILALLLKQTDQLRNDNIWATFTLH